MLDWWRANAVSTWVRKLGPTHVLLTRLSLDAPLAQTRYWGSTLLEAAFSSAEVRSSATTRPALSMAMRPHRASASSR